MKDGIVVSKSGNCKETRALGLLLLQKMIATCNGTVFVSFSFQNHELICSSIFYVRFFVTFQKTRVLAQVFLGHYTLFVSKAAKETPSSSSIPMRSATETTSSQS